MSLWRFAIALSVMAGISANAQSPGFVLQPGEGILASAPATDGGLWLKTRVRTGTNYRTGITEQFALIRITPQSTIDYRRTLPAAYERGGIIPHRDGVLALHVELPPEQDRASVQWEYRWQLDWFPDDPEAPHETWYTWTNTSPWEDSFAVSEESSDAIYVSRQQDDYLTKVGPDGKELWRRDLQETPMQLIGTIPEGLVLMSGRQLSGDRQTSTYTVAIWSADGSPIREMDLTLQGISTVRDSWLVQPGTLVLLRDYSGTNQMQFEFFDIDDQTLRSIELPISGARTEPAAGGVLVLGDALRRGILIFIGADGEVVWNERSGLAYGSGIDRVPESSAVGVRLFGPDRIGLSANRASDDQSPPGTRLVSLDTVRSTLAASHGPCLVTDVLPIAAREHRILGTFGIAIQLGVRDAGPRPTDSDGCELPSDADYAEFLDTFADELMLRGYTGFDRYEVSIAIGVDAIGDAFELRRYFVNSTATDSVDTTIEFVANAAAGRVLAEHVALNLAPHLVRVRGRVDEYYEITRCQLSVSNGTFLLPIVNAANSYRQTEEAVSRFISGATSVMADIPSPERDPRIGCGLTLGLDGLGVPVTPLSELLDLLRVSLSGPR